MSDGWIQLTTPTEHDLWRRLQEARSKIAWAEREAAVATRIARDLRKRLERYEPPKPEPEFETFGT